MYIWSTHAEMILDLSDEDLAAAARKAVVSGIKRRLESGAQRALEDRAEQRWIAAVNAARAEGKLPPIQDRFSAETFDGVAFLGGDESLGGFLIGQSPSEVVRPELDARPAEIPAEAALDPAEPSEGRQLHRSEISVPVRGDGSLSIHVSLPGGRVVVSISM